ncbi:MAG: hypothetical protein WCT49_00620 [Candidatus Paceibacterota bacterium]|jgi:hypothetical protein|nr:hypothetical protein [Candidatus Paceibacterota bacterium]
MNYRKKILLFYFTLCFFLLISIIPFAPHWFGFCDSFVDYECKDKFNKYKLFSAIISFASSIIIFGALLVRLRIKSKEAFLVWQKFAIIWIPISILLIARAPAQRDCFFGGPFCSGFDREGMIWFTAGIFFIVSIAIIAVKTWKLKGK